MFTNVAELDTPDYMVTFSGIICTLLTLQLSEEQVRPLIFLKTIGKSAKLKRNSKKKLFRGYRNFWNEKTVVRWVRGTKK